jgi:hypothetical protein
MSSANLQTHRELRTNVELSVHAAVTHNFLSCTQNIQVIMTILHAVTQLYAPSGNVAACIREIPSSNLGRCNNYPDGGKSFE